MFLHFQRLRPTYKKNDFIRYFELLAHTFFQTLLMSLLIILIMENSSLNECCLMCQHGIFLLSFADDIQMYLQCNRDDLQSAAAQPELRIFEVDRQSLQTQHRQD